MKRPESVRIFWTDWIQVSKTFSLLAERLFSVAQRDFVVCRFYNHLLKKEGKKEKEKELVVPVACLPWNI